jgi:hypothetical protein
VEWRERRLECHNYAKEVKYVNRYQKQCVWKGERGERKNLITDMDV